MGDKKWGRDPATEAITRGEHGPVWSMSIPGVLRGDMARVQLVAGRAFVELVVPRGGDDVERLVVEVEASELRKLVRVLDGWPGIGVVG